MKLYLHCLCAFKVWCLSRHKDNFILTLLLQPKNRTGIRNSVAGTENRLCWTARGPNPGKSKRFFCSPKNVQTSTRDYTASYSIRARIPSREYNGRGVRLTTHFHLVSRSRMSGAKPLLVLYAFLAWSGIASHFYLLYFYQRDVKGRRVFLIYSSKNEPNHCTGIWPNTHISWQLRPVGPHVSHFIRSKTLSNYIRRWPMAQTTGRGPPASR